MRRTVAGALALVLAAGPAGAWESAGYPWAPGAELQASIDRLRGAISPDRLREHLKALTAEPHPPGSPGDRAVEEYLFAQLRSYGLEPRWNEYEILASTHEESALEITHPVRETLSLHEEVVPGDPYSARTGEFPAWFAYGASGEAEGEVVYANFGTSADFARLKRLGVDLTGKIVLLKFYEGGRGGKIDRAHKAGAAGVLVFSDPIDDGYVWGPTYPDGPWRPLSGIQRGSVEFGSVPGDPQSPGWPSTKGAKLLPVEQLEGLPRIPALPISARDARKILERMTGHPSSPKWAGAMGFNYRTGPGPVRVRIRARNRLERKPIRNLLVTLEGSRYPDQVVILGNHHDAHVFGAGDPNSGTAVQLEYARIFGEWRKQGWRPKRTILIASWCGEEYGLSGSTEWVEENAEAMRDRVVVNFNSDSAIFNVDTPLWVGASATLHALIQQTADGMRDPRSGRRFSDVWLEQQREYSGLFSSMGEGWQLAPGEKRTRPKVDINAGTDDNMPFYYHLVVPGTDMFYGTDYGMYHSIYENFHWMSKVIDPTFRYHALMTELIGTLALRVADDDHVPFDYAGYARRFGAAADALARRLPDGFRADFAGVARAAAEWQGAAEDAQRRLGPAPKLAPARLAELTRAWYRIERAFYSPEGLPGSPWYRNLYSGPAVGVDAESDELPGLEHALGAKDPALWKAQTALYRAALERAAAETRAVIAMLEGAGSGPAGAVR